MNFLQQLASEWYRHEGYFVRTNVKALKRLKGGWDQVRYHSMGYVRCVTESICSVWLSLGGECGSGIQTSVYGEVEPVFPRC